MHIDFDEQLALGLACKASAMWVFAASKAASKSLNVASITLHPLPLKPKKLRHLQAKRPPPRLLAE